MKRNPGIIFLIFIIFFVISLLTNILGPLIPDIIKDFKVSLAMAAFLPFSFFAAYGVMSIPAGIAVEKYKEKKTMLVAFLLAFSGALLFAIAPRYDIALISLFSIGLGMAMLQVAINPLLREAGGEEHFAFNSVFAQLVFGSASFLSPMVYTYLVNGLNNIETQSNYIISFFSGIVPGEMPWVSLYWIFAFTALAMAILLVFVRFPEVRLKEDEKTGTIAIYKKLFTNKTVILYFFGIFAYVGTEQGIANWISKFLLDYHGYSPHIEGARAVSYFWGMLTIGCFLGLILLKFIDSRKVLIFFSSMAIISLTMALFGNNNTALYAFPLTGFFASVMWSIIFSLALNSMDKYHGSFSGILVTGIIGGAVMPLIVGFIGDMVNLRVGMSSLYLTLGYILLIGFWAKPLINNKTISIKKQAND